MKDGTVLKSVPLQSPLCQAAVEAQASCLDGRMSGQRPDASRLAWHLSKEWFAGPTAPGQLQGPELETE